MDHLLDASVSGPVFLRQPEIAGLMVQALHEGQERLGRYHLHAYVVMPNHVHLLVTPRVSMRQWLGPLKGFTGHRANQILGRRGPFWQEESYDHLIRNDSEFQKVWKYIEDNPVRAGLAGLTEEFPWSSAWPGGSPAAG